MRGPLSQKNDDIDYMETMDRASQSLLSWSLQEGTWLIGGRGMNCRMSRSISRGSISTIRQLDLLLQFAG